MLRGEPGGSLKGAEVPMRTRAGRWGVGGGGGRGSDIQDPDDDDDAGVERV